MRLARWLLPALSLLAIAWFSWAYATGAGAAPGPLHPAHARVPSLDGGAKCDACHAPGAGVDAQRCLACHAAVARGITNGTGLHGSLAANDAAACATCHPEHHGADAPLLAAHAFPRAGVADAAAYDHRHVVFALDGVHRGLACERCHAGARDAMPPVGGRYLGLSQACTSCHADAHAGAFGADCASCHGQNRPWPEVPHFAHERLPLRDAHARVACMSCHAAGTDRDVAAERAAPAPLRACRDCHADPHGGAEPATAVRLDHGGDCAHCHEPTVWRDARFDAAQHASIGFPLHGAHAAADCARCHGDGLRVPRWTGDAPEVADCAACHAAPHRPAVLAAAACDECHDAAAPAFASARITAAAHAATGFVLAPPHDDVACSRCHSGPTRAERFPGRAADDCRGCHVDAHAGQFAASPQWRQCTSCHSTAHFRPHAFGAAAHAKTAFPLDGAHTAVGCDRCHSTVRDGVRAFAGTPHACASCHADVHGGRFDVAGASERVDGRTGCVRCHDTNAFAPVREFDHRRWTGFQLDGAHGSLACAKCHPAVPGAAPAARWGKAAGTRCASCHADPHAGQFAHDGATDCARCHSPSSFRELRFDHARDSRFALDAAHGALPCSSCHRPHGEGERAVVRYRPLGTQCADCHRLPPREVRR